MTGSRVKCKGVHKTATFGIRRWAQLAPTASTLMCSDLIFVEHSSWLNLLQRPHHHVRQRPLTLAQTPLSVPSSIRTQKGHLHVPLEVSYSPLEAHLAP